MSNDPNSNLTPSEFLAHILRLSELQQQNASDIKELINSVSDLTSDLKSLIKEYHIVSNDLTEYKIHQETQSVHISKLESKVDSVTVFLLKAFASMLIIGAFAGYILLKH